MSKLDLIDLVVKLVNTSRSDELNRRRIIRVIEKIRATGTDFSTAEMRKHYETLKNSPALFH
jgi:hypothetical protein